MEHCPYAYRKIGDVSLHCCADEHNSESDWCAHQFFCPDTGRCEVSPDGARCPLRERKIHNDLKGT